MPFFSHILIDKWAGVSASGIMVYFSGDSGVPRGDPGSKSKA
jgi:hypothetical protein